MRTDSVKGNRHSASDHRSSLWTHVRFYVDDADLPAVQDMARRLDAGAVEIAFVLPVLQKPVWQIPRYTKAVCLFLTLDDLHHYISLIVQQLHLLL